MHFRKENVIHDILMSELCYIYTELLSYEMNVESGSFIGDVGGNVVRTFWKLILRHLKILVLSFVCPLHNVGKCTTVVDCRGN